MPSQLIFTPGIHPPVENIWVYETIAAPIYCTIAALSFLGPLISVVVLKLKALKRLVEITHTYTEYN